jgi:methylthioribulose-1-phosphate dehydratase
MDDPYAILATAGRQFDARGWVMGTTGNLSTRGRDDTVLITASGRHKGELARSDFVSVDLAGAPIGHPGDARPSRETAIHCAIYRRFPSARFCFHVHSVESNIAAERCLGDGIELPALEMLKILGVWDETPKVQLAAFTNHLDVARIAADIEARFAVEEPDVPAILVRRHGVTAWGATAAETRAHVEAVEFLLRYLALGGSS